MRLPRIVAHADWSVDPAKRWTTQAILGPNGRYCADAPALVGCPIDWLRGLAAAAGGDGLFLGFDFPIGLPRRYAVAAGISSFIETLPRFGRGPWCRFYDVAATQDEIGPGRPFYPLAARVKGRAAQAHLVTALGLSGSDDLRRICDVRTVNRGPACPMFWTVGANQVGKAAITGWRDLLVPALRHSYLDVAIWPFHGPLGMLLEGHRIVVAETYPGECYSQLGINFRTNGTGRRGSKRRQSDRALHADQMLRWSSRANVHVSRDLKTAINDGFGTSRTGEDAFDATVGLFGMLNVLGTWRETGEPENEVVHRIEGWILGLDQKDLLD